MKRNQKGFTLMEMLIVVAIIAVLVAIAIPVYTSQMHKVRVAADWANVRAYYAQIQADYMLTEKQNEKVKVVDVNSGPDPSNFPDTENITFLDGTKVKLQAGTYVVRFVKDKGYSIAYTCSTHYGANSDCNKVFGE